MNVRLDPRREATSKATAYLASLIGPDDAEEQFIADIFMAVLILANVVGMEEPENFSALAQIGNDNAAKAAAVVLAAGPQ